MNFLVYEHWRPDTDVCFYVGKGKMKRARTFEHRNSRYGRIVRKLTRLGLTPEIKIVARDLTEPEAFAIEIKRIAHWRGVGIETANYTDGGDGSSGHKHSTSTRDKIRKKAIGSKRTEETKARMSEAAKRVQPAARKAACSTEAGRQQMLDISRKAAADPAVRSARSANAKALWADPAYREKVLAARGAS
jgi:hypothetical protein